MSVQHRFRFQSSWPKPSVGSEYRSIEDMITDVQGKLDHLRWMAENGIVLKRSLNNIVILATDNPVVADKFDFITMGETSKQGEDRGKDDGRAWGKRYGSKKEFVAKLREEDCPTYIDGFVQGALEAWEEVS